MISELLARFNFLDYIMLIVFLRTCYIASKMGLSVEIFKLSGTIFSTYIALHYYTAFSDSIQRRFFPKAMPLEFVDFITFLLLVAVGYFSFVIVRVFLYRFVQLKAIPRINQFIGFILGIGRGFLLVGLIAFALAISSVNYLSSAIKHSYFGSRASEISPQAYDWLWNNIFSKFSFNEKFNPTVAEAMDRFKQK